MYEGLAPGASMEEVLAHYGVLGMHWGVRKKEEPGKGRKLSAKDKALLKKAGVDPRHSASLKAKYGPSSHKDSEKFHLTPKQKKILIGVGVGVGVAAAIGAAYYFHQNIQAEKLAGSLNLKNEEAALKKLAEAAESDRLARWGKAAAEAKADATNSPAFQREWAAYVQRSTEKMQGGFTQDMVDKLSTDRIELPAGHVLKRMSTEAENSIRPGGFFAAHAPEDVDRYKAILPVFWKQWGYDKDEGYIVNIAAKVPIKAPSHRETFEMFKNMLDHQIEMDDPFSFDVNPPKIKMPMKEMFVGQQGDNDTIARAVFPTFANMWANGQDEHPMVQHFFAEVKKAGFNALPDMNDAGALAKSPLRTLDGSNFDIIANEPLTKEAIRLAQEGIAAIAHRIAMIINNMFYEPLGGGTMALTHQEQLGIDFLAHYGVLGMKWGTRRRRASTVQIHAARGRVATEKNRVDRAEEKASRIKDPKERAKAEKNVGKMKLHFLNNPDRVISARMTRGEKAAAAVLGVAVLGVGLAPAAAAIAGTSARSRRIERKQELHKYK